MTKHYIYLVVLLRLYSWDSPDCFTVCLKRKGELGNVGPDFSQVKKIIDKERKKGSLFDT
jgi:hypothetical protein